MTLSGFTLSMRFLGWLFGAERLDATPEAVALVFPTKRRIGGRGVGFRTRFGREFYFWTFSGSEILTTLEQAGFTVDKQVQRPSRLWGP